ncbi:nucleotidyltransferase family protein [Bradyrhizobium sp.]|uniref:nucleotidyltransferase family protein n=1 Tax=Bradyrhizobium sp. TaxID=376 RepID=UPI0025C099A3|nr:nucleotidyltransferase family protein [Bradyrhizobium sp.]
MERLPPSVSHSDLALLGKILEVRPTTASSAALRLAFFDKCFSWPSLVEFANAHDLLAPFVLALRDRSLLFPVPHTCDSATREKHVTTRLTSTWNQHLERQDDLRDQLLTIIAALNEREITPLLIKGACHLTEMEGWSVARGMRDLDIVVQPAELGDATAALKLLGYEFANLPELDGQHHLLQMQLSDRHGAVELHSNALAFNAEPLLPTDRIRELSVNRDFRGTQFRKLPAAWHVLHGLLHHQVADRGHARHLLALKGLWEFSMGANELSARDWHVIIAYMENSGQIDVLLSWVAQGNSLFGLPIPETVRITENARAHASETIRRAAWPYPLRRAMFITDQFGFAFHPDTLAQRYGSRRERSKLGMAGKHLIYLLRKYRGDALHRLIGSNRRIS